MNERTIITIPLAEVRSTMKARTALIAVALIVLMAGVGLAQRGRGGRGQRGGGLYSGRPARYATADDFTGGFQFCRVVFPQGNGDGAGWNVDWPRADINLSILSGIST